MTGIRQYGIRHTPLVAQVCANKRKPDQVVAFIGAQICFFERSSSIPRAGEKVEVMITRPMYGRYPEGHERAGAPDYASLRALMIEVVDPLRHMLVAIDGFECSGSMCRTTAHGRETDGLRALTSEEMYPPKRPGESTSAWIDRTRGGMWLTPGRCGIRVADNVNVGWHGREAKPLMPTNVWVETSIYDEKRGCGVRVAGLTRIEDGEWAKLVRLPLAQAA